jgi:cell division protein FtsQ
MIKSKKKRKNRYQESMFRRLKGNFRVFHDFFIVFVVFCFVVLLGAGLSRVYHKMLEAPWCRLEEIEITGLKKLERTQILNAMGLRRGQCTLGIGIDPLTERLKTVPAVRDASVRFDSHRRIVVAIDEREPAAVVKCGDSYMLMDIDGILFSEVAADARGALPLITGLCDPSLKTRDQVPARRLELIRQLLAAIDHSKSWLAGTAIDECSWSENGFTLVLGERAVPVDIGKDLFEQKIVKLRKVINTLNERDWTDLVTRIDLDYPGRAYLEGRFPTPKSAQGQAKQPG